MVRFFYFLRFRQAPIEVMATAITNTDMNIHSAIACCDAIDSQEVHPGVWVFSGQVSGSKKPIHQASTPTPATVASIASELFRTLGLLLGYFCLDLFHIQVLDLSD